MKIYHCKKARKPHEDSFSKERIEVGSEYYWAKARNREPIKSTDRKNVEKWIQGFRNSKKGEMTTNVEEWERRMGEMETSEERDEIIQEINDFIDQKQESLENMPQQLQEGHMINDQIEELEQLIEEVESVELDEED